jgi:molecular chaperone DnaK
MAVGFDFGTTNSLISVIVGDRAIDVTDEEDLPFPSVVRYEGERVTVGRAAKESLDTAGIGIHGNAVRSPKFLLGEESVHIGGVERSPVDIVHDVVSYVRREALSSVHADELDGVRSAVVTIPVTMDGPRRRALRDAFARSDIGIVQFVHEPLAALYGYIRGHAERDNIRRTLSNRNVLVVDWGGGTLDLTLCRVEESRIVQIRNGGSSDIGGDRFDEAIRDDVIRRFSEANGLPASVEVHPDARLQLLHDAEEIKKALSDRESATFYRPDFFRNPRTTLEYRLARSEMEQIVRPMVSAGIAEIEALLESVSIGPAQVAMCLVVGGMAAMPAIRGRLHEIFGPQRVEIPSNSATLVSQGSAWIAHDSQPLVLSKPIELQLSRGSFLTLVTAGAEMPSEGQTRRQHIHLYCTDPTDGIAKVSLYTPQRVTARPQPAEPRAALGHLTVQVDPRAQPFTERLELEAVIDDDLILHVSATSADVGDKAHSWFHNLEFGLNVPGGVRSGGGDPAPTVPKAHGREPGTLSIRANVTSVKDQALVPGEVLYRFNRFAFEKRNTRQDRATAAQIREYLYYTPCAVCGRRSSDPDCHCASHPPTTTSH